MSFISEVLHAHIEPQGLQSDQTMKHGLTLLPWKRPKITQYCQFWQLFSIYSEILSSEFFGIWYRNDVCYCLHFGTGLVTRDILVAMETKPKFDYCKICQMYETVYLKTTGHFSEILHGVL